jgi:hypothetical protein
MISSQESAPESSSGTKSDVEPSYDHAVVAPPEKSSLTNGAPAADPHSPDYFSRVLDDAELLLKYAAEKGKDVNDKIRSNVLEARAAYGTRLNEQTEANLLAALTTLVKQLKPPKSLLSGYTGRPPIRTYFIVAICLAIVIVPFSVLSFISSAISDSIRKDIVTANELAVKLTTQLGLPEDQTSSTKIPAGVSRVELVTELQTFAALIRAIHSRGRQLNLFIFDTIKDPYSKFPGNGVDHHQGSGARVPGDCVEYPPSDFRKAFQLPVPLPSDLLPVLSCRILVYQDTRMFGQDVIDDVSILYGAMATCVLPVLYALLGACAFLLRSFAEQMKNGTYVRSHSDSARFLIAAIGGGVVGLFGNFTINQAVSVSPFAIAFLVGYSVDVFFSFLEGLINAFRSKP